MKYMVSGMKPVAVKKPFNFDAAYEALEQSFRKASDAYEALVTSGSAVEEFEACLRDGAAALESIKKYGVTPQNMSLINEGNQLDKALGLEALDMTAIESLSESTKKLLQNNYTKGLEALGTENIKSFIQSIKDFFLKIVEWLKERFFGTAKLVKILKEEKFDGEFNGETQINAIEFSKAEALLSTVESNAAELDRLANGDDLQASADKINEETTYLVPDKKADTVAALGYTKDNIGGLKDKFVTAATGTVAKMDASWKKIQANYKKFEAETKGEDPSIIEKGKMWFKGLRAASKCMGQVNKALQAVGMSILAAKKAFKAAAPAEPAPAA